MLSGLFKLLSLWWLVKAVARGPRGLAGYAVRKGLRRAANRGIRRVR